VAVLTYKNVAGSWIKVRVWKLKSTCEFIPLQFGGKLVSFGNTRGVDVPKTVSMSRIVTETEFLNKSRDLEQALAQGNLGEFCDHKIGHASNPTDKNIWNFMKVGVVHLNCRYLCMFDVD